MSKIVGVLGGMGPYATSAFFESLVQLTPASKDWDHLRIIIDDNPHIPSRTRHFLYGEASPYEGMLEVCKKLERYPVDLIVIPCNSASVFIPQLRIDVSIPILNILEITAASLARQYPSVQRVAALGAYVTYTLQSYKTFLHAHGVELVLHEQALQERVLQLIEDIKVNGPLVRHQLLLQDLIVELTSRYGAEAVILACTEFGCLTDIDSPLPLLDSSLELARYTVDFARP